ncbi:ABC transporter substrate-binding protein [Corynebacterium ulceribovis]|uniref:ABC transporter substrate-binding protein n=1 Tax=Corynebacterium ulceribovis TaxID=487732 RepID=UPI00058CCD41|nr:ABC transporter substrate-binding protein [Corynebacterium ulceribovis]
MSTLISSARRWVRRGIVACVATATALTTAACVTNTETGNPDGWQEIKPAAVPQLANQVPADVRNRGTLRIGTNPPFAPAEFKDSDGNIIGFDMDLARAAASVLGLELAINEQDFNLILPSISAGALDAGASGFTDTEERRKNYDFVNYLDAGIQWARQPGNDTTRENVCGRKIAVQKGTVSDIEDYIAVQEDCAARGLPPVEKLSYQDSGTAATAVLLGRADVLSADSPVSAWAVARSDDKLELVGDITDASQYGWPVPKDSPLGPLLAEALDYLIATGDYQKILETWGLEDGAVPNATLNGKKEW